MVINYLILAHKQPAQLKRLVDVLGSYDTYFYIHIDREVDCKPFREVLENKERVFFLADEKRVTTVWGSMAIVEATLALMREVVKAGKEGYSVLMSGQCYPIKSNEYIRLFFQKNYGTNFIEGFKLPNPLWSDVEVRLKHYTFYSTRPKRKLISVPPLHLAFNKNRFQHYVLKYLDAVKNFPFKIHVLLRKRSWPANLVPFGGMAYWAMPLGSLRFILNYVANHPEYPEYHKYTLYPDEIFMTTLVHNFLENNQQQVTYASWPTSEYISPKIFTMQDFSMLQARSELFARKFDIEKDATILDMIDRELLNTNTIKTLAI